MRQSHTIKGSQDAEAVSALCEPTAMYCLLVLRVFIGRAMWWSVRLVLGQALKPSWD